ncbi:MAG TPA: glycosyltransferase family 4 protein [Solirubrobacterales bacterium]|nr:glycosyltransferase family 4 protein [Solirubrobacterales bacterium]
MRPLRIALLYPWDSADRAVVSGTGFGLARGLEEVGVEVVRIHGRPPRVLLGLCGRCTKVRWRVAGSAEDTWRTGIESTLARNAAARVGLRRANRIDGIVQLASDFLIRRRGVPLATYDDMTIQQAIDADYPAWRLAGRDLRWRRDRQLAAYREARACCTRSAWAGSSICTDYGIDRERAKVVGVGRNREIAVSPGRSWETPRFLFVAADWERKNGPRVLTAFEQVRRHHPQAQLHVVGRHPRIDAPGVQAHGFLSLDDEAEKARLDRLFAQATCFVMPSLHEALGISYAEAGGAGIPSIGTRSGGAREVIGPGGTVVDPLDLGELVEAMERFCDPGEVAAAGERARAHSQLYTWPRVAKRILHALGRLSPEEDPEAAFLAGPN